MFVQEPAHRSYRLFHLSASGTVSGQAVVNTLQTLAPGLSTLFWGQQDLRFISDVGELPNGVLIDSQARRVPDRFIFEILFGPDAGRQHTIGRGNFSVGRAENDICIDDHSIDSYWGSLTMSSGGLRLRSGNSVLACKFNEVFRIGQSYCRVRQVNQPAYPLKTSAETPCTPIEVDLPAERRTLHLALMVSLPLIAGLLIAWLTGMWLFLVMAAASSLLMGANWISHRGESKKYRTILTEAYSQDACRATELGDIRFDLTAEQYPLVILGRASRTAHVSNRQLTGDRVLLHEDLPFYLPVNINAIYRLSSNAGFVTQLLFQLLKGKRDLVLSTGFLRRFPLLADTALIFSHVTVYEEKQQTLPNDSVVVALQSEEQKLGLSTNHHLCIFFLGEGNKHQTSDHYSSQLAISSYAVSQNLMRLTTTIATPLVPGFLYGKEVDLIPDEMSEKTFIRYVSQLLSTAETPVGESLSAHFSTQSFARVDQLPQRWRSNMYAADIRLFAGVSIGEAGQAVSLLNLHLNAHGPHFLLAGTTGSGKSHLLRGLLLSSTFAYPPQRLSYLLIDFKGGSALGPFIQLPHTVGQLDDLDSSQVDRALRFLKSDVVKREQLFKELRVTSYRDYLKIHETTETVPEFPELIIVIDEFKMLVESMPQSMNELMKIATIGRSLGIHLVLSTQRPQGAVSSDIRANISTTLCLRVASPQDSINVLGVDDAAKIPHDLPGYGYVRLGEGSVCAFQGVHIDQPPVASPNRFSCQLLGTSLRWEQGTTLPLTAIDEQSILTGYLKSVVSQTQSWEKTRYCPLPPALQQEIPWTTYSAEKGLILGRIELPESGKQENICWLAQKGSLQLVASYRERYQLLEAVCQQARQQDMRIIAFSSTSSGFRELQRIDQGTALDALISPLDIDFLHFVVEQLCAESSSQRTVIIIDGMDSLLDNRHQGSKLEQLLFSVFSEAEDQAHLCLATGSQAIRGRFGQVFGSSLLSAEAVAKDPLRSISKDYPSISRGYFAAEGNLIQSLLGDRALTSAVLCATVAAASSHQTAVKPRARQWEPLPKNIEAQSISQTHNNEQGFLIGISDRHRVALLEAPAGQCTLIKGISKSGKTTALAAIRTLNPAFAYLKISGCSALNEQAITSACTGVPNAQQTVLLVDDLHLMKPDTQNALMKAIPGFRHCFITFTPWAKWMHSPLLSALNGSSRGVVLQPSSITDLDTFTVFTDLPLNLRSWGKIPPGRGVIIKDSRLQALQIANTA